MSEPTLPEAVTALVKAYGLPDTPDVTEHLAVLLEATAIMVERDAANAHNGLWKQYGAADTAFHLKSKGLRAANNPNQLDDSFDAINYAAFTIRNVRAGRL